MTEPRLLVLESFKRPQKTTNPYICMLLAALRQVCDVDCFSWREALFGKYDVFHVHWPDVLIRGGRRSRIMFRRLAFAALLLRLSFNKIPIVRTVHNPAPHEGASKIDAWLLDRLDRMTTSWIRLNPYTAELGDGEMATILHGHYRDWFPADSSVTPDPCRLIYFGHIRRYKGTVPLLKAFASLPDPSLRLSVNGSPHPAELRKEVETVAVADSRVELNLSHIDDDDLAREVRRSAIVVLPYKETHNSGALLLALSLDRPVLVPENEITLALGREVGAGWVLTYSGELTSADLASGLSAVARPRPDRLARPDLSQREWALVGEQHLEVFERAIGLSTTESTERNLETAK